MEALEAFSKSMERAEVLLDLHMGMFPKGRPPTEGPSELLRATVVFAVGSLDSYLHDKIRENFLGVLQRYVRKGDSLPGGMGDILKTTLTLEKSLALIYRSRPDEELRKIVGRELANRTYQDPGQIERGLKLLGISDLWEPLRKLLGLNTKNQAKAFILPYVTRRHQIVHEADMYKAKKMRHRVRGISRPYTKECIRAVRKYVVSLDSIIEARLKS